MHLHHRADSSLEIIALWLGREEDLDRMKPAGHLHEWCGIKIGLELAGVERCGHDDELQVWPLNGYFLNETKENIGSERALVSLVENDCGITVTQQGGAS